MVEVVFAAAGDKVVEVVVESVSVEVTVVAVEVEVVEDVELPKKTLGTSGQSQCTSGHSALQSGQAGQRQSGQRDCRRKGK